MPFNPFPRPTSLPKPSGGSFRPTREEFCRRGALALLLALVSIASAAHGQNPADLKPQGYVNDFASVLSQSARDQLTSLCTEVDQKAQAQIAVVTVKSLGGQPIEDYSLDLATRWGVGPKGKDRGILLLFAVDDHKYRTEVGYGLEGILPDGKVGGFGREAVPYLRENNYDAAILLFTRRIADVIAADRGVTLSGTPPPPTSDNNSPALGLGPNFVIFGTILLIILLFRILGSVLGGKARRRGGWWIGPMIGGGMGGGWGGGFGGGGFGGGGGGGGFGGFGGGGFGGGGASGSW